MFTIGDIDKQPHQKVLTLILNGHPDKHLLLQYNHNKLTILEILKSADLKWGIKIKRPRLFNCEGVEYYEQDLKYLRTGEYLYLSRGQEFDANSSFGEYEIIKTLGEGGFGKVVLGQHKNTKELVAIKVMKANKIKSAHDIDVVFREAENLKSLNHPNIVKIHNCYTLKQMQVVIIMEYLEGGELLYVLKEKGKFSESEALMYFKQMVSAINYCHWKNIVHRDLKLDNILLKSQGSKEIKIADFGISGVAKKFNPDYDTGTLKYMAPQILSATEKGNSPAVDVWALGCILFYMLYGRLPFLAKTSTELIELIMQGNYRQPSHIQVSQNTSQLLKRMLDINPKSRIQITDIHDSIHLVSVFSLERIKLHDESHDYIRKSILYTEPKYIAQKAKRDSDRMLSNKLSVFLPKRYDSYKKHLIESREYLAKSQEKYESKIGFGKSIPSSIPPKKQRQRMPLLNNRIKTKASLVNIGKLN